jgi:tetratricopeptide (TPR) repeat protein
LRLLPDFLVQRLSGTVIKDKYGIIMAEEEEGLEEYKYQANLKKDAGNVAFEDGNTELAISLFTQAIDIDPDNVVFYSNRSAAYMKVDSVSKALHDAEKCVELDPKWPKGYNRLGVAQQKLKRFDAAIDSFKKGISRAK